jgi:hypothetical protein
MFKRGPIPFRWIFPLGQLLLCWFMTAATYSLPLRWLYFHYVVQIIRGLDLPGGLVQLPSIFFRVDKTAWHPPGIENALWCAISWPVLALLFWWMAGRALEALQVLGHFQIRPRITLIESIIGGVFMAGGIVLVIGLTVGEGKRVYTDFDTGLFAAAGGLWAVLGGLSVVARFRQWRLRRTLKKSASGTS